MAASESCDRGGRSTGPARATADLYDAFLPQQLAAYVLKPRPPQCLQGSGRTSARVRFCARPGNSSRLHATAFLADRRATSEGAV